MIIVQEREMKADNVKSKKPIKHMEEWKKLFDVAIRFKNIKCWRWMYDSDVFGIQNPVTGEIGYCCVLGNAEEVFGLTLYNGSSGLSLYLKVVNGEIDTEDVNVMHLMAGIQMTFEDRELLDPFDLQLIKELGYKFRGRNQYPFFRNLKPGFYPWFLQLDEIAYLTVVVEQAIDVCLRFKDNPDLLTPHTANSYLVRVFKTHSQAIPAIKDPSGEMPEKTPEKLPEKISVEMPGEMPEKIADKLSGECCGQWVDVWLEPQLCEDKPPLPEPLNELLLFDIRRKNFPRSGIWELDLFYSPIPVRNKKEDRPHFPYVLLIAEQKASYILNFSLLKENENARELPEQVLRLIKNVKLIPEKIQVGSKEAEVILAKLASELNVKLEIADKLLVINDIQKQLFPE
ncbi:MAG: hypothetical protein HQK89_05775 [Nitrospirae bacterium]|nr:hypothetical protein [Nitrospirota bacterium]